MLKKVRSFQSQAIDFLVKDEQKKIKGFWPREVKIVNKLFEKYSDESFWITLDLGFKLNSIAFFLTEDGRNELEKYWRLFNLKIDNSPQNVILGEKIGEDIEIKPIKTLREFLNE